MPVPGTLGGSTPFLTVSTGNNADFNQISTKPSQLIFGSFGNIASTPAYVKFFDTAAGATSGAGMTAIAQFIVPGNTAGAGSNISPGVAHPPRGLQFTAGIAMTITTNIAKTDASGVSAGNVTAFVGWT